MRVKATVWLYIALFLIGLGGCILLFSGKSPVMLGPGFSVLMTGVLFLVPHGIIVEIRQTRWAVEDLQRTLKMEKQSTGEAKNVGRGDEEDSNEASANR